jgi:hypothetical protein
VLKARQKLRFLNQGLLASNLLHVHRYDVIVDQVVLSTTLDEHLGLLNCDRLKFLIDCELTVFDWGQFLK